MREGGIYHYLYNPWNRYIVKETAEIIGNNQYTTSKKFNLEDMIILEESLNKQNINIQTN